MLAMGAPHRSRPAPRVGALTRRVRHVGQPLARIGIIAQLETIAATFTLVQVWMP
ncbi:hypothetical protein [Paraburkholderia lacunae]|uniref:hypothetical protein n=1 Tax=Paraburkholderia lacunae TaxID=2211104 RepID=UPI001403D6F7|nr:hypothetical protein [Paraburkholderia lacunae]